MKPFTIGILGGMGPRATVLFEQRLIDRLEGGDQAMPRIITVNDGTVWDRTKFLNEGGNDPLQQLVPNAQLLKEAGVDVVCLPCNTAHAGSILARLQSIVPLPIIDMPAVCITAAERRSIHRLLILGTDGTRQNAIYESRARGRDVMTLNDLQQETISDIIARFKRGETVSLDLVQNVAALIRGASVDGIVLACTELSFLRDSLSDMLAGVQVIDSMDELAERCVSLYSERKEYCYDVR